MNTNITKGESEQLRNISNRVRSIRETPKLDRRQSSEVLEGIIKELQDLNEQLKK